VASSLHRLEELDLLAGGERDHRLAQPGTVPICRRPRRFCFGFTVRTRTPTTVTLNSASTACLIWNLFASRATANV
jgi:hypothetical protein